MVKRPLAEGSCLTWLTARLAIPALTFAIEWAALPTTVASRALAWKRQWAVSNGERHRLRAIAEAVTAHLSGLSQDEFAWILRDCDRPVNWLATKPNRHFLEPQGFWRVQRELDPELRLTILAQVAFHDLKRVGLDDFLSMNDGEGWMLPDRLRLADYGLGHDDRACEHQPVASVLGPRFYPWQCERSAEESWRECELHADLLRRIDEVTEDDEETGAAEEKHGDEVPTDLFGNPLETDLFGNIVHSKGKRQK